MENKTCQNCKQSFSIDTEDQAFYDRIEVPLPTFCPECRMIRRFAFRNQNKLFKVKDHFTDEALFSLVPPNPKAPVTTNERWFSDMWDPMEFGQDYDFSRPFLEQLMELHAKIPQINLNVTRMTNSPYSGNANDLKNCYLVFNAAHNEDCLYATGLYSSNNCVDNCDTYHSESCYQNFWIEKCNKVHFSEECTECSEVWFSKNCTGCVNCVGCVNLRNKSYCIFNEQYDKESYFAELEKMKLDTHQGIATIRDKSLGFWMQFPKKAIQGVKNVDSTGAYVSNSKNVKDSYVVNEGENLRYVQYISQPPNKDCYDVSVWGDGGELAYEYASSGSGVYNSKFFVDCWPNIRNLEYSIHCSSVSDVFGCIGLRNKEYCILNKQYDSETYYDMVGKIKQHMNDMPYVDNQGLEYRYGEFFPIELSWYGYNNTMAQDFFPITKAEAESKSYPWYEVPRGEYQPDIRALELPERIKDVDDSILSKIISCETCSHPYRLQAEELNFLRRENLPLPHRCPDCRYKERTARRLPPKLYKRTCMHEGCDTSFMTAYDPERSDIVYCESCYQKEVI